MAAFLDASSALFQTCAFRSCLPEFNSLPRTGTVRPDGMTFGPSVRGAYLYSESQNLRILWCRTRFQEPTVVPQHHAAEHQIDCQSDCDYGTIVN